MKVCELSGALLDYWVARAELDNTLKGTEIRAAGENRWTIVDPEDDLIMGYLVAGIRERFSARRELNLNGTGAWHYWPSGDWAYGGPIIERDQIFLQPPSEVHYNGGPNHGWRRYDHWRATVSARTRTLPPKNEVQEAMNVRGVGRGAGETALIAAMRAKVASHYGDEVPDEVTK